MDFVFSLAGSGWLVQFVYFGGDGINGCLETQTELKRGRSFLFIFMVVLHKSPNPIFKCHLGPFENAILYLEEDIIKVQ